MIAFLFWIGFALCCGSVFLLKRKIELLKCTVLGTIYYFMFYVVISGLLFLCRQFSIKRVTFLLFVVWGVLFAFFAVKNRKKEPLSLSPLEKQSWFSYLIIVVLLLVFSGSFGYFGMGQDQGVYQVETINFANGRNEWLTTFPEYDQITDEEYKNFYRETVDAIPGVELVDVEYGFRDTFQIPRLGGLDVIYHGIPTYPAILGLGVKLFGIECMMLFQAIFYVVMLLLVEILLREHRVHWAMRAVLITVLGVSPVILWMRKSTLTEMFLAVLMTYYLYKITDEEDRQKSFSVFSIIVFSFFHASAFSILPVFIVNYWILYFVKKDSRFLRNAAEALAGFCIGFVMMFRVEPIYMAKNFLRLMEQKGVYYPYEWTPVIVILMSAIVAGVGFLFLLVRRDAGNKLMKIVQILLSVITVVAILDFLSGRSWFGLFFASEGFAPNIHLIGFSTLAAYAELTGFFLLPLIMIRQIICFRNHYDTTRILVANVFTWVILIYAMVFRVRVIWYYYNARYLVPFLSTIIIFYGLLYGVGEAEKKEKGKVRVKVLRMISMILPALGICIMLPYSNVVRTNQDDTNLQWSTLSGMMDNVKAGDIVLMDQNEMWYYFYPIRSVGAFVYPVMDNFETTLNKANIDPDNQNIFYISEDRSHEDDWRYEIVYESKSKYQLDDQNHYEPYLRLPVQFAIEGERSHKLYHWVTPELEVNAKDDNFVKGWSVVNAAGFRWMSDREAEMSVYLQKGHYQMRIRQGDSIPFGAIKEDRILVDVYINGQELEPIIFTGETKGMDMILDIPKDCSVEGENTVSFVTRDMWSPAEYGAEDSSSYVFSVAEVQFEECD